jgi:Ca-activated chloride channel family protein
MVTEPAMIRTLALTAATALIAGGAEFMHARRIQATVPLLHANHASPAPWTHHLPWIRTVCVALLAGALSILFHASDSTQHGKTQPRERHLVALLDVSPSMLIRDAGKSGGESRAERAARILTELLNRCPGDHIKMSLIAFYTEPKPLVQATTDRNVIRYMASELPLHILFKPGKTDLLKSINLTPKIIPELPYRSASLLVLSDGDAISNTGLNPLPKCFDEALFVGVGRTSGGTFIDDHNSRQDNASLASLARRLRATYLDLNQNQLPLNTLPNLTLPSSSSPLSMDRLVPLAKVVTALTSSVLSLIPIALAHFGTISRNRNQQTRQSWMPQTTR